MNLHFLFQSFFRKKKKEAKKEGIKCTTLLLLHTPSCQQRAAERKRHPRRTQLRDRSLEIKRGTHGCCLQRFFFVQSLLPSLFSSFWRGRRGEQKKRHQVHATTTVAHTIVPAACSGKKEVPGAEEPTSQLRTRSKGTNIRLLLARDFSFLFSLFLRDRLV